MTLDKWMADNDISNREFERLTKLKIKRQQVALYRELRAVPRLRSMIDIYKVTGGAVKPADFYPAKWGGNA
jgi:hypothetical protein